MSLINVTQSAIQNVIANRGDSVNSTAALSTSSPDGSFSIVLDNTASTAIIYIKVNGNWIPQTGGGGSAVWGGIIGTLSNQADLQAALNLKADLVSPALTGTPTAPTATVGTNTTQVATTAFVLANAFSSTLTSANIFVGNSSNVATGVALSGDATISNTGVLTVGAGAITGSKIASATITAANIVNNTITATQIANATITGTQIASNIALAGAPTTTTATAGDNSTKIATTEFVANAASALTLGSLSGVVLTSPSAGQVLSYNGTSWINAAGGSGSTTWGSITGTLFNQADLQAALNLKADLVSPALTGTPTAPTATVGTNTTQVATTAFVLANAFSSTLTSANIFVGNSSNIATGVALTGDLSITNTGVTTVGTETPTASKVAKWDANINLSANNLINSITTTATAAGTTTLTVTSTGIQRFTGSTTQTVVLPDATTLSTGTQYLIQNESSGAITVQASGGGALTTINGNKDILLTLATNGSAAGTWHAEPALVKGSDVLVTDPTGIAGSSTDAYNLNTVLGNVYTGVTYAAVNSSFTISSTKNAFYVFNNSTSAATITLPASPADKQMITFYDAIGGFANRPITIARNGTSYTIGGSTSSFVTTFPYQRITLLYQASALDWRIVDSSVYDTFTGVLGKSQSTKEMWVDLTYNSDTYPGSVLYPKKSITGALSSVALGGKINVKYQGASDSSTILMSYANVIIAGTCSKDAISTAFNSSYTACKIDRPINTTNSRLIFRDLFFNPSTANIITLNGGYPAFFERCTFKSSSSSASAIETSASTSGGTLIFKDCDFSQITGTNSVFLNLVNPSSGSGICYLINCNFSSVALLNVGSNWTVYVQGGSNLVTGNISGTMTTLPSSAQVVTTTTKASLTSLTGVASGGFGLVTSDGIIANNGLYYLNALPTSNSANWIQLTTSNSLGSLLTGYVATAGTISATDNILQAIQKIGASLNTTAGQIIVGNASNVATAVALSGDATITNTGVLTVGTETPTASKVAKWDANINLSANNLINSITTTATAIGTTTLSITSTGIQRFTGTATQTVVLPDATTLNNGIQYLIQNESSGAITVQASGTGTTLAIVSAGTDMTFTLATAGTATGTWHFVTPSVSGITALTGDVTASGTGSVVATIANGVVTGGKIANTTITAANIVNNTITATQIANATITGTQIASSIALAGSPTTTTATFGDISTKIATTEFVSQVSIDGGTF